MKNRVSKKFYVLPAVTLTILLLFFVFVGTFLANEDRVSRLSKASSVAQQVRISLNVFAKEREQAINSLAQNWPTFEPNKVDWFNAQAVTLMDMQGGYNALALVGQNDAIRWITFSDRRPNNNQLNAFIGQPVSVLGINSLSPSDQINSELSKSTEDGHFYLSVSRLISPQEPQLGYIVARFDVQHILDVMMGQLVGPEFNFVVTDNHISLFSSGNVSEDVSGVATTSVKFLGRMWDVTFQTQNTKINYSLLVTLLGAFMSFVICWIMHKQIKGSLHLSDSQKRYQTASEAALDALLIYASRENDFFLMEANKFSFHLFKEIDDVFRQKPLSLQLQKVHQTDFFKVVCEVFHTGIPHESYVSVESRYIKAQWLKVQVVKAGMNVAMTVRDVTARFQAQQALKCSEERYRRLVDGMHRHFVYTRTAQHKFKYVSAGITTILGYDVDDFCDNAHTYVTQIPDTAFKIRAAIKQGRKPEPYLVHYQAASGKDFVIEFSDTPLLDDDGALIAVEGIARDVTKEQSLQEEVIYQATHDQLTGLMNRYAFDSALKQLLKDIVHDSETGVMCFVDMDRFKLINDSCGHPAGDRLLNEIAGLFNRFVRHDDIVARLGGDEFCIVFRSVSLDTALSRLDELISAISEYRFGHEDKIFYVGASVGVVDLANTRQPAAELIKAADNACYNAKRQGRNRYSVYSESDIVQLNNCDEPELLQVLSQAIADGNFVLYCQPIIPLSNDYSTKPHFEVLLRLPAGNGELISPGLFIPLAERHGLMNKIDWYVVDNTLAKLEKTLSGMSAIGKVAVNLSGASLGNDVLLRKIITRVQGSAVPPECLCFEITETSAVTNLNSASEFIRQLKNLGCSFALDDFGAGMSSFTYLKNLDVDFVKIDGSFVRNMVHDPIDFETVKAISAIANSMGKQTIAEFVTDKRTAATLKELRVDFGQGFALGRPEPFHECLSRLSQKSSSEFISTEKRNNVTTFRSLN